MKTLLSIALAVALGTAGASRAADPQAAHQEHHPAPATTAPQAPAPAATPDTAATAPAVANDKIDAQLERMRQMHERMAKATPAERGKMMAEQMQVMQDGMAMMHAMSMPPMADGAMAGAMPPGAMAGGGAHDAMHEHMGADMKQHHDAMQRRMQMMEAMLQMMMDRLAEPAASH